MAVETGATTIAQLVESSPTDNDKIVEGDDHIRVIKSVLKDAFPGSLGNGFDTPIISTEEQLNWLSNVTSDVQDQFDAITDDIEVIEANLQAPVNTRMLFHGDPPLGWEQDLSINGVMMRIIDSTPDGSVKGRDNPIENTTVPAHTHTTDESGSHSHYIIPSQGEVQLNNFGGTGNLNGGYTGGTNAVATTVTDEAGEHTHSVNTNDDALNWFPLYTDVCIGVKT